jgi:hypothetical protein
MISFQLVFLLALAWLIKCKTKCNADTKHVKFLFILGNVKTNSKNTFSDKILFVVNDSLKFFKYKTEEYLCLSSLVSYLREELQHLTKLFWPPNNKKYIGPDEDQ